MSTPLIVNNDTYDLNILNVLKCRNLNRILIGHLNINSLGSKLKIIVFDSS